VAAATHLLADGATIPFIARYRKEVTGSLDEVAIAAIRDRLEELQALAERREAIIKSLEERALLTDELKAALDAAATLGALEDIYQPFRPKRRTRAMIAREKGLESLADLLWSQEPALDPTGPRRPSSTRSPASSPPPTHLPGRGTSSRSGSATTLPPARPSGACSRPRASSAPRVSPAKKSQGQNSGITSSGRSPSRRRHRIESWRSAGARQRVCSPADGCRLRKTPSPS